MLPRNGDDSSKPSDCIRNRLGSCSKLASQQTIPERRPVSGRPKFSRGERNFWMERPEAKNPPERPLLSAETGNVENRRQHPAETASFRLTTVSAVREETIWTKLAAPHAGIEPSLRKSSQERNFLLQRPG